jgi:hypothetical protein
MALTLNHDRVFEKFVAPENYDVRKKYSYRVEKANKKNGWPGSKVTVERNNDDGSIDDVYVYRRNYSMMNTFEPFRHLSNGVWGDYALISPQYVRFEVLNLQTGTIVAVEQYPKVTVEDHERWKQSDRKYFREMLEKYPVGTEQPGSGFCPVDFYVPDYFENCDENDHLYESVNPVTKKTFGLYPEEELLSYTGQYALYTGCVWGDDSSYKLRYIDLSQITEGKVVTDSRFGYVPVYTGEKGRLKDSVNIIDGHTVNIAAEVTARLATGKIFKENFNWNKN